MLKLQLSRIIWLELKNLSLPRTRSCEGWETLCQVFIHKWHHDLRKKGISRILWQLYWNLFAKKAASGGVKNYRKSCDVIYGWPLKRQYFLRPGSFPRSQPSHGWGVSEDLRQVSISSTFYTRLFCTKVFCAAFLLLKFGFLFIGKRILAQKLLIKCRWNQFQVSISSTFYTRLFCTNVLRNFSLVTAWLFNFLAKKYHLESCS